MGIVKNQVIQYVERDGDRISQSNRNVDRITQHNFNFGVPIPFMLFTKPLSEIMKFNFNPDKINLLYVYAGYQFQDIKDIQDKKECGYLISPGSLSYLKTLSLMLTSVI